MTGSVFLPIRAAFSLPKNALDWDFGETAKITIPDANAFVYQSFEQGSDPGPALVPVTPASTGPTISAGGISIHLVYDSAALGAPSAFRAGIEAAAMQLAKVITNQITVNIQIHYSGSGGGASAKPDDGIFVDYATVRDDLINSASPGDPTFAALPAGTSIQGQNTVAVFNSQLKALGISSPNITGPNDTASDDGEATFATDIPGDDLIGIALHEISHALGRVPYGPQPDIFDLFRFTGAGTRLMTSSIPSSAAYFSIDGGKTKLADFGLNSDPSDFLNNGVQGPNDPFNEFYTASTTQALVGVDLEMLDALGFHILTSGSVSIALKNDNGASASDKLSNDATLTGAGAPNGSVTLKENGATIGTATVAASGVWSFKPSLADGAHTIVVSQGSKSASLSFTLATKAPTLSAKESVSGQTTQTSDTITVTAAAEAVAGNAIVNVEIFDGSADLGAAKLSGGVWTYLAGNLLPGAHNFTARATDAAGNAASNSLATVTVTGAPPPPNAKYTLSAFVFSRNDTTVTDIRAKSVNDLNEVVGYYIDGRADEKGADGNTYYEHGFYSTVSSGSRSYFGIDDPDASFDTGDDNGLDRTRAFSVNNTGNIVGWYSQDEIGYSSAGDPYILPDAGFIYAPSGWSQTSDYGKLGFNALNDLGTHTLGINDQDDIVGYYNDGSGVEHGLFRAWTGYNNRGDYVSIDPAGSINTIAEGVNDSDLIVGYYESADTALHGFAYSESAGTFTPIDFNGATSTAVLGVNNIGEMVGYYIDTSGKRHGFVRSAGGQYATIDNANAGSAGTLVGGINNFGEIVGWYTDASGHDASFAGAPTAPSLSIGASGGGATFTLSGLIDVWDVGLPILLYDGATYLKSVYANLAGSWTAGLSITATGVHNLTAQTTNAGGLGKSQTVVDLVSATTTLTGGGQIALFGNAGDKVILSGTANVWDAVYGSGGTINLNNAQASVLGGGNVINYGASVNNAASLYNTGGNWDAVYATSGTVTLVNAQASVIGGDNSIYTDGSASDAVSLYNTAGNWDAVYGGHAQVYLTGAQASVVGGANVINIAATSKTVAASTVSLYNTKGAWDAVYGSGVYVYLTAAQNSILGGGDSIYGFSGSSISLYNTGGNWDAVYGDAETVYLTGAQASILGKGNTIALASGATASLYNTGGTADSVSAAGQTLILSSAQANLTGAGNYTYFFGTNNALNVSGASEHFLFQAQLGLDKITGFVSSDTIHLAKADWASFSALQGSGALQQSGADTLIRLDANNTVTLANVAANTLTSANFAFG